MYNNGKDNLGKFNPHSDEGIFLGYSNSSKSYRIFNKHTSTIEESIHVVFDESNHDEEFTSFQSGFITSKKVPNKEQLTNADESQLMTDQFQMNGEVNLTIQGNSLSKMQMME